MKNKRILLFGSSGFLGACLHEKLKNLYNFVLIPAGEFRNDLRIKNDVDNAVSFYSPEIIINCAGTVGGIAQNLAKPAEYFYNNLMIGMNIMDTANKLGVKKYIQIGTTCSYPVVYPSPSIHMPMSPDMLWDGYPEPSNSAYGIAKRTLIEMSKAYRKQYNFNSITPIFANLYGPGCKSNHVIPDMISKFIKATKMNEENVVLFGSGRPTREFLYISDAVNAIVLLLENYDESTPINCGSGEEISIFELANKIKNLINFQGEIVWNSNKPDGQSARLLDSSEIRNLGWKSEISIDAGLEKVVESYLEKELLEV